MCEKLEQTFFFVCGKTGKALQGGLTIVTILVARSVGSFVQATYCDFVGQITLQVENLLCLAEKVVWPKNLNI